MVLALMLLPVSAGASKTVRLLHATEMDWSEGRRSIEAELAFAGYTVDEVPSQATDPNELLRELVGIEGNEFSLSVTVIGVGRSGIAYVCFSGSEETFRLTSSDPDPSRAAGILALRVVELVLVGGMAPEKAAVRRAAPAVPLVRPAPAPAPPTWSVFVGGAVTWTSGAFRAAPAVELALQRRLVDHLSLELSGAVGLLPHVGEFPDGTVDVTTHALSLAALANFDSGHDENRVERFVQLGPRVGAQWFEVSSLPAGPGPRLSSFVCVPVVTLAARLGLRERTFSFWLGADGSYALEEVRLIAENVAVATLGRPSVGVAAGGGWSF